MELNPNMRCVICMSPATQRLTESVEGVNSTISVCDRHVEEGRYILTKAKGERAEIDLRNLDWESLEGIAKTKPHLATAVLEDLRQILIACANAGNLPRLAQWAKKLSYDALIMVHCAGFSELKMFELFTGRTPELTPFRVVGIDPPELHEGQHRIDPSRN